MEKKSNNGGGVSNSFKNKGSSTAVEKNKTTFKTKTKNSVSKEKVDKKEKKDKPFKPFEGKGTKLGTDLEKGKLKMEELINIYSELGK